MVEDETKRLHESGYTWVPTGPNETYSDYQ